MNPRVSRSSALASKATGFPIAKIAAKLALGYHLDEIPNDITRLTPASFEPTIDYVVVKVPRWAFEKFPRADRTLTTQMKSVGEVMAIGRTFKEAFMKAFRSLELGASGSLFGQPRQRRERASGRRGQGALQRELSIPTDRRMWAVFRALDRGWTVERASPAHAHRSVVPAQFSQIVELRAIGARSSACAASRRDLLRTLKRAGFGDRELGVDPRRRRGSGARARGSSTASCPPTSASTPAPPSSSRSRRIIYGTYEKECEADPTPRQKVVILGSGPNRIGQGHRVRLLLLPCGVRAARRGVRDRHDQLQPRDGLHRLRHGRSAVLRAADLRGRVGDHRARAGGRRGRRVRRPVRRADAAEAGAAAAGGGHPDPRHVAGFDRPRRGSRAVRAAAVGPRHSAGAERHGDDASDEAREVAAKIGFPLVVRPSYVLGGRAMAIVYDMAALDRYMTQRRRRVAGPSDPDRQVPRGCRRARRRCRRRCDRRGRHRRHHGAHRGGGHPLGRQLLRGPAVSR